jgi:two-component system, NarL family, sensor kinase
MIFRIVQELLNNAIKHSQASEINVDLSLTDRLVVEVRDNGVGFDPEAIRKDSAKGLGLFNIENRVRLLDGNIEFESHPNGGTKAVITLPVTHEQKTQSLHS